MKYACLQKASNFTYLFYKKICMVVQMCKFTIFFLEKKIRPVLREKGVKWGINYNFSEKTIITFAAETVLY